MVEAHDEHYIPFLSSAYDHIAEETLVFSYVEEGKSMLKGIFLYEQTDGIGRLRLKITMFYVKHLVEEASHMEAKTILFLF